MKGGIYLCTPSSDGPREDILVNVSVALLLTNIWIKIEINWQSDATWVGGLLALCNTTEEDVENWLCFCMPSLLRLALR